MDEFTDSPEAVIAAEPSTGATDLADDEVLLLEEVEDELVLAVWEPTGRARRRRRPRPAGAAGSR